MTRRKGHGAKAIRRPARRPAAGRRAAGRPPVPERPRATRKPALSDPALAAATAKAAASIKSTLIEEPTFLPDDPIKEAEQIGLLLGEPEEAEEDAADGEGDLEPALPGMRQTAPRRRGRPAPAIVVKPGGVDPAAEPAPGPSPSGSSAGAAHLFPRNLALDYPVAVRAEGIWIFDSAGRKYLDGCGGAVVCSIGHGVKEIADVMTRQARRLAFAHSSQFITRETIGLADRIAALAPGDMRDSGRVYLVSGGSEAIETAIKLARQYHVECGQPGRFKVVSRWQSYHGSTLGALSVTGNVARREPYAPLLLAQPHIPPCYCYRCPYGLKFPKCGIACVEELEGAILQEGPETVAAFLAEPIVGATLGAVPAVEGYWKRAREICTRHNVLLIADEVMTGVGRTGRNFAVDHFKVVPDILVAGKGLSGGYAPLGAVIARGFIFDAIGRGRGHFEHGYTYSANPLSAAIGSAVLDYVAKHRLIARAARMGRVLGTRLLRLRRHPIVGDVRGMGMMWGIEIVKDRRSREPFPAALRAGRRIYEACLKEGLLIYPGSGSRQGRDGDHFLIAPPFTIARHEIDDLVGRLDRALARAGKALR